MPGQLARRPPPMADAVLLLLGQLGHRAPQPWDPHDRVVAKPALAGGLEGDAAGAAALKDAVARRIDEDDGAAVAAATATPRHVAQQIEDVRVLDRSVGEI